MESNDIDTDISNYSLSELMAIIDVDSDVSPEEIIFKTNKLINKFKKTNNELSVFFKEIQECLLEYSQKQINYNKNTIQKNKPIIESFENMITQSNKVIERKPDLSYFENKYIPNNPQLREQLDQNDAYQDALTPHLKNTITRFINLDSQFRTQLTSPSTDYTIQFTDTIKDVLTMRLYSYQLLNTWYTIDSTYGNNCFWITIPAGPEGSDIKLYPELNIAITVPDGNYSPERLTVELYTLLVKSGFSPVKVYTVYYNRINGLITLDLYGSTYKYLYEGYTYTITISETTIITFFDSTGLLQCTNNCYTKTNRYFNNTLGWIMGYRSASINVDPSGNISDVPIDLNGPKYLILLIDDFTQNHINNTLVSIAPSSNNLKVPTYYSPDIPFTCQEQEYTNTEIILPSAPRTLTQSQIYTINEINKNNNNGSNFLFKAPTNPDTFALMYLKPNSIVNLAYITGNQVYEYSSTLQDNIRTYFGPVNLEKLSIKLLDDKGNLLNLHGTDWCLTLICECLYQH